MILIFCINCFLLIIIAAFCKVIINLSYEKGDTTMQKYFCNPCGYTYDPEKGDPEHGIAPGTAFEDLPDDWVCPICGIDKSMFQPCIDNYN